MLKVPRDRKSGCLFKKIHTHSFWVSFFLPLPPPISRDSAGALSPHYQPCYSVTEKDLTDHSITQISHKPVILLLASVSTMLSKTKVWYPQLLTDGRSSYPTVIWCKSKMTPTEPFFFPFFHFCPFSQYHIYTLF